MTESTLGRSVVRSAGWSLRGLLFAALLVSSAGALAELAPGEPFPELSLPDQHGEVHAIDAETRLVLFAADRPASDLVNGFLKAQLGDFLSTRQAEYIADISTMPGLITRLVALPRMRERPYRILLVDDPVQVEFLPRRPKAVTVLRLTDGRVEETLFATEDAELAAALAVAR